MNTTRFESIDFNLSDNGIHLLRNRFNYKTVPYQEVDSATIKRHAETKNVKLTLAFAFLLLIFACYQSIGVFESLHDPRVKKIYIEAFVLPILPALIGIYCIYLAIRKVPTLIVSSGLKIYQLRLTEIVKNHQQENLELYLKEKLGAKFLVRKDE